MRDHAIDKRLQERTSKRKLLEKRNKIDMENVSRRINKFTIHPPTDGHENENGDDMARSEFMHTSEPSVNPLITRKSSKTSEMRTQLRRRLFSTSSNVVIARRVIKNLRKRMGKIMEEDTGAESLFDETQGPVFREQNHIIEKLAGRQVMCKKMLNLTTAVFERSPKLSKSPKLNRLPKLSEEPSMLRNLLNVADPSKLNG